MKINLFLWVSLLMCSLLLSQERTPIKGKLLYKNTVVVAANVVNNTAQTNTITDSEGEFEIEVAEGDEIIFSSVQYQIRVVTITPEILAINRLVVSVTENINELREVVVTTEDIERFLDLKEEEFKGFDYEQDKSTRVNNKLTDDRVLTQGIDFVNIAKLIVKALNSKSEEERMRLKPSEVLPQVFEDSFFENDLKLQKDQVVGFLEYIDTQMKTSTLLKQSMQFQLIDYLINQSETYKETLNE
jgi:hypothetical protein